MILMKNRFFDKYLNWFLVYLLILAHKYACKVQIVESLCRLVFKISIQQYMKLLIMSVQSKREAAFQFVNC